LTRGRGDRRSTRQVAQNKTKTAEIIVNEGLPVVASQQLATELGVSRMTLHRYLKDLKLTVHDPEKVAELKLAIALRIAEEIDKLEASRTLTPEGEAYHRAWSKKVEQLKNLLIPPAPTQHQNLNFNLDANSPAATRCWQRALYELRLVPEEKHNEFWERSKPLIEELSVQPAFPQKELTDGKDH
jgi:AcrR family transcriptional regulator